MRFAAIGGDRGSVSNRCSYLKNGLGKTLLIMLIMSREYMDDIMKIVKSYEESVY